MPDCFDAIKAIIVILVDKSIIMEDSNKSLIELLRDNEIIEIFYSIWITNPINLDTLDTFTKIMEKHPDSKQFFIEKNTLGDLFQFLQNYNNSKENDYNSAVIVINVINFFAEYFHNNSDVDLIHHAHIIKEIVVIFGNACDPYSENQPKEDEIIISFWKSCLSALNKFASDKPSKARLLINYKLPHSLFLFLNSNTLFRPLWPRALELILKFFRSEFDELENLADIYIDFSVFHRILQEDSSIYVVYPSLIFSALIDINPTKYATLFASSDLIDIIFNRAQKLSFNEFIPVMILYCRIFLNIARNLVLSKLFNEDIIERLVDASEVEIDSNIIEDLKKIFIIIYEMSDNQPKIQNLVDRAFEEDGILSDVPRPLIDN